MILPKETQPKKDKIWLLFLLPIFFLAAQCRQTPPTPLLPAPPAGPVVRVALLSPTQGELATFGRMMRSGSLLAFEQWNNQGGLLGHQIEWELYHTDCQFDTTTGAIQQAVADEHRFIIGPLCSDAAIAAAQVAEEAGVLMIAPAATHPLVTVNSRGQTRPTVFRASFAYPAQGQAAARFAYQTLDGRAAVLFFDPHDDYETTLVNAFAQEFEQLGGHIRYRVTYNRADVITFSESLAAVQDTGAGVIYVPASAPVVNHLAAQLKELPVSGASRSDHYPILLGSDSWQSPELNLNLTDGSYFVTHFVSEDPRPVVQTWVEDYKSAYAIEPETLAALGYDAAILLLQATHQAGTFEPGAVAQVLEQATFEGVTGPIRFNDHHNPLKPIPVVQIRDGQIILTSP